MSTFIFIATVVCAFFAGYALRALIADRAQRKPLGRHSISPDHPAIRALRAHNDALRAAEQAAERSRRDAFLAEDFPDETLAGRERYLRALAERTDGLHCEWPNPLAARIEAEDKLMRDLFDKAAEPRPPRPTTRLPTGGKEL